MPKGLSSTRKEDNDAFLKFETYLKELSAQLPVVNGKVLIDLGLAIDTLERYAAGSTSVQKSIGSTQLARAIIGLLLEFCGVASPYENSAATTAARKRVPKAYVAYRASKDYPGTIPRLDDQDRKTIKLCVALCPLSSCRPRRPPRSR